MKGNVFALPSPVRDDLIWNTYYKYLSKCGKRGHIQRVCRSSKAEPKMRRKQNYFCDEDDDAFVASVEINKVKKSNSNIIWVTTKIDGQAVKMELDTGSAVSTGCLKKSGRY